jgi:hypothetical protein
MAPEQDASTGAFYDHENSESAPRRRRAAADWGVGEDIFDRMPSRRFKRTDRRAEHHEDLEARRFERRTSGPARGAAEWDDVAPRDDRDAPAASRDEWQAPRRDDFADAHERRQVAPRRDDWAPAEERRPTRRPAESWTTESDEHSVPVEGKRSIESWLEPEPNRELTLVPGESRTIVLGTPEPAPEEPPARRTVVISGHPDRLPVVRTPRPPRTAVERIGASPDRIVGYAVLLGFVLVLIAVLTTNQ